MNRIQDASPDSGDKMWPPRDAESSVAMQTSRRVRHIAAPAGGLYTKEECGVGSSRDPVQIERQTVTASVDQSLVLGNGVEDQRQLFDI